MICNELWKKDIQIVERQQYMSNLLLTISEVDSLFNRRIFDIYGCLILDSTLDRSREIELTQEQFEKAIQYHFDKTGYEYSNNEFRILDYIEHDLNKEEQYLLSLTYIKYLNSKLTLMTNKKVNYILFFEEDVLQIRFYQEWEGEKQPYNDNLEDYNNPIAIYTSDELSNNVIDNT